MAIKKIDEKTSNQLYGRIVQHLNSNRPFAIIGSQDSTTYESRFDELMELVRKYQYKNKIHGFNYVDGTYTYDGDEKRVGFEESVILYDISKEDALDIGRKLNQQSIIYKDDNDFVGELRCSDGSIKNRFPKSIGFHTNNYPKPEDLENGLYGTRSHKDKRNLYGFRFEAYIRTGGVTSDGKYYGIRVPVILE